MGNEFAHRTQFLFRTLIKLPLKMEKTQFDPAQKKAGKTLIEWFESFKNLQLTRLTQKQSHPLPLLEMRKNVVNHAIWLENYGDFTRIHICHMTPSSLSSRFGETEMRVQLIYDTCSVYFGPLCKLCCENLNCTFPNTSSWESNRHCSKTDFYLKESEK